MLKISFNNLPFQEYIQKQKEYGLDVETRHNMLMKGFSPLNFETDHKKYMKIMEKQLRRKFKKKDGYQILKRKSTSRRGYHYLIFKNGRQLFLSVNKVLKIRKKIKGECPARLRADVQRAKKGLPISILFNSKNYKYPTIWKEI